MGEEMFRDSPNDNTEGDLRAKYEKCGNHGFDDACDDDYDHDHGFIFVIHVLIADDRSVLSREIRGGFRGSAGEDEFDTPRKAGVSAGRSGGAGGLAEQLAGDSGNVAALESGDGQLVFGGQPGAVPARDGGGSVRRTARDLAHGHLPLL